MNADGVLARLIALALFVGPVAIALSLAAHYVQRGAQGEATETTAAFACFCVYVAIVGTVTLAPPPMSVSNGNFGSNFIPLIYTFRCFTPNPGQPSTTKFCLEITLGNFALFVPLGALLPLILRRDISIRAVFIVALGASVAIESLQFVGRWVGNPRWSDVDDVIFNVTGAVAGFALVHVLRRYSRRSIRPPGASDIF